MMDKPGRPSVVDTALELPRAALDFLSLPFNLKLLAQAPRGSSSIPVLVLPGFMANGHSTIVLRYFFKLLGYTVRGWDNGVNTGPSPQVAQYLAKILHEIHKQHNAQVIIIAHSLGGVYARELARAFPALVDRLILFGTPFASGRHPDAMVAGLLELFKLLHGADHLLLRPEHAHHFMHHPLVPATSIYTRRDGIVHWRTCVGHKGLRKEYIEIPGTSHSGLILNALALLVAADRAAAEIKYENGTIIWPRFDPKRYQLEHVLKAQAHETFDVSAPEHPQSHPELFFQQVLSDQPSRPNPSSPLGIVLSLRDNLDKIDVLLDTITRQRSERFE